MTVLHTTHRKWHLKTYNSQFLHFWPKPVKPKVRPATLVTKSVKHMDFICANNAINARRPFWQFWTFWQKLSVTQLTPGCETQVSVFIDFSWKIEYQLSRATIGFLDLSRPKLYKSLTIPFYISIFNSKNRHFCKCVIIGPINTW